MLEPYNPKRTKSMAPQSQKNSNYNMQKYKNQQPRHMKPYEENNHLVRNDFFNDFENHSMNVFKEFDNMHNKMIKKMENAFSGFGFGSQLMKPFSDPFFSDFSKFSNLHDEIFNNQISGAGTMVSRSYVQSSKIGQNGQKHEEKYFSNNVVQKGSDGNTISEKRQGYNNSSGVQKIAQERMLNNQGRKFVQERMGRNGQVSSTNHFLNMNEDIIDEFDSRWNNYNERIGFYRNNHKYLMGEKNPKNCIQDTSSNFYQQPTYNKQQYKQSQRPQQNYFELEDRRDFKDDYKRGDFIPYQRKQQNQPVQLNNYNYNYDDQYYGRQRINDIQPIMVGGGTNEVRQNQNNQPNNQRIQSNNSIPINNNRRVVNNAPPVRNAMHGVYKNTNKATPLAF